MTPGGSRRVRVVYWNNIPSPYMVERFNALADRGVIDFQAWFNERTHADRSWRVDERNWSFEARYLPRRRTPAGELSWAGPALRKSQPDVLISLFSEPSFMVGWAQARRAGVATAFRVLAPSQAWHRRSAAKEVAKRFMFRRVDGLLVPGDDARGYALSYGPAPERILRESQVVDSDFFRDEADARRPERRALREALGLDGTVFVYVGRLWSGKGVDHLVEAFARAQGSMAGSLLLIGDGVDEERLRAMVRERGVRNVVFAGFRHREELPALLAASDVFVLPTLGDPYALVIDEAMSAGLPVLSTTSVGEIAGRVRDGETGFTVAPADSAAMAQRMMQLAGDERLREHMAANATAAMRGRTPELWARDIEHAAATLAARRRS